MGSPVRAMEITNKVQVNVVNRTGGTRRIWKEVQHRFANFFRTTASVQDNINLGKAIAKDFKSGDFEVAKNAREIRPLWSAKKISLLQYALLAKGGLGSLIHGCGRSSFSTA